MREPNEYQEALDYLAQYCGAWEDEYHGGLEETCINKGVVQECIDIRVPREPVDRTCPQCHENIFGGHDLPEDDIKFCFNCGQAIKKKEETP
mgnify:CR=1 FL=1